MNKKIVGVVFVAGILVLVCAGCGRSAVVPNSTNPTVPGAGDEAKKPEAEQPKLKTTGQVTDAECFDVLAHQMWAVQLSGTGRTVEAMSMTKQAEDLQTHYGINDDDFENICNAKIGDADFEDRVQKRMKELGYIIK